MKKGLPDFTLLLTVLILAFFGLFMIASAGIVMSHTNFDQPYFYLKNQLLKGGLLGIVLGALLYFLPLKYVKKLSFFAFFVSLLTLILVFVPGLGLRAGGAQRWINLGFFSFQPTDILKLTMIVYLAAWFEKKGKQIKDFKKGLVPFVVLIVIVGLLVLSQPNISTFALVATVATIMFFAAGANFLHLLGVGGLGLAVFGIMIRLYPHVANRVQVLFNPGLDPHGIGYQIKQAMIAIGSGGIFGVGLGQSLQKYKYLPEPVGDSIVAVIGEELGFLGLAFIIVLFGIFAYKGIQIAKNSPDKFSSLTATGITAWISLQAIINIAAISGLAPLTGVPLPFISYGSTAFAVSLGGAALLLNISRLVKK